MPPDAAAELRILPVRGLPEVAAGDNLADLLVANRFSWQDGDVVVVTSKVVSKAEDRLVTLGREAAIDAETVRLVAQRGSTRIVQTRHGLVLAAAGVDASNVPAGTVALLPEDPDASAARIRDGLRSQLSVDVAVLITDTMGRPWRNGLVDVCIGAAGLEVLTDLRGQVDSSGHRLDVTVTAVADELAAAAELVKGKLAGVPVAVVRGWPIAQPASDRGARPLVRVAADDMFRLGTAEARRSVVAERRNAAAFDDRPVDRSAVERAVSAAVNAVVPSADGAALLQVVVVAATADGAAEIVVCVRSGVAERPSGSLLAGAVAGSLLIALGAEGLGSRWEARPIEDSAAARTRLGLSEEWVPVTAVAVGYARGEASVATQDARISFVDRGI